MAVEDASCATAILLLPAVAVFQLRHLGPKYVMEGSIPQRP